MKLIERSKATIFTSKIYYNLKFKLKKKKTQIFRLCNASI